MYSEMGLSVVVADFDPQANATAMFLDEDELEEFWTEGPHDKTILGVVEPIRRGKGDIAEPYIKKITQDLGLIIGDLGLSAFEDKLSAAWPLCLDRDEAAFRTSTSLYRTLLSASEERGADVVLIDVGPNLGAINRAALIAAQFVVIPLAPDLFSLQGLRNLGPTLRVWRDEWKDRLERKPRDLDLEVPEGQMNPVGYVVMQHNVRLDRPVKYYELWMSRIPQTYRTAVLDKRLGRIESVSQDSNCLATLKHYRSLMPMAMEARKPIFKLTPADGAIGSHYAAVQDSKKDFRQLATEIGERIDLPIG